MPKAAPLIKAVQILGTGAGFDVYHFSADEMCMSRFKSISSNRLLPVYKYVHSASVLVDSNENLKRYLELHNTKDKLFPANILKQVRTMPLITDYDELLFKMNAIGVIHKQAGLLLKNIDSFSVEQIRAVCKKLFNLDRQESMKSTHFKRCVMYIDFIENYTKMIG